MLDTLTSGLSDANDLLELAIEEDDSDTVDELVSDLEGFESEIDSLEFRRMFSGELDNSNAFLDIQSGAGGTEAQDWAEILLRMYLRWCEAKGYKTEITEYQPGDEAGTKGVTFTVDGSYAYDYLKAEKTIWL